MPAMNANFDTLKHTELLKSGGLDDAAAKAITRALDEALHESVATRADLRDTEARLTGRIDKLEGELNGRMDKLEGQLNGRMDKLEGQLWGLRGEIHILMWSIGGMFAIVLAILGWIASAIG
jgi:chromosome segregation ATPase